MPNVYLQLELQLQPSVSVFGTCISAEKARNRSRKSVLVYFTGKIAFLEERKGNRHIQQPRYEASVETSGEEDNFAEYSSL